MGEVAKPLISEGEHYELLSMIAIEMWVNGAESLRSDMFEFIAEMFSDAKRKDKVVAHQITERIKQHALITSAQSSQFGFDHEEFYLFFLGEGVGRLLVDANANQIRHVFKEGLLPGLAIESAANFVRRAGKPVTLFVELANKLCIVEPRTSFVKENLGGILIRLLDTDGHVGLVVSHGSFPPESLCGRNLNGIEFRECYFQSSRLGNSLILNCNFINCDFENLEVESNSLIQNCIMENCECRSIVTIGSDTALFAPQQVRRVLVQSGFNFPVPQAGDQQVAVEVDEKLVIVSRMLRAFLRSTGLNEHTLKQRLGSQSSQFFRDVLPILVAAGLVEEVPFRGSGIQKRYQLGVSLERLTRAAEECGGSFPRFVDLASEA